VIGVCDERPWLLVRQALRVVQAKCRFDPRLPGPNASESKGDVENLWRAMSSFQLCASL
jgi:hypothetical protein